jgi:glucosamine 6-phosphate synthetase-like amidotransferase/phosphosugar isomerase protein
MAGVEDNLEKFLNADRIIIVACGTSWHKLVAEVFLRICKNICRSGIHFRI